MKLLVCFLLCFISSFANADTMVIYPKDVKGWPQENMKDLQEIQNTVDNGTQPWLASPEDYAATFVESYYGLKGEETGLLPDGNELEVGERSAVVRFYFKGKDHLVELEAPVKPHSQEGIWAVKRMLIKPSSEYDFEKVIFHKAGGDYYDVSINYPQVTDLRLSDKERLEINKRIKMFVNRLYVDDLKGFMKTSEKMKKELGTSSSDSDSVSFEVNRFDDRFLSIKFDKYFFGMGAAHGLEDIEVFNYDIKNNHFFRLKDLFKHGTKYLKQISEYCFKDLHEKLKAVGVDGFVDDGWIHGGAGPYNENLKKFCINNSELIMYFDVYQVACYAAGPQEVKIPFKKLVGFKEQEYVRGRH